jgi:hypothetical protein
MEGQERWSLPPSRSHNQCLRRAGVVCVAASAGAEVETRCGARPSAAGRGARDGAGGTSVALRTSFPWVLLPTRVTFLGLTTLSL